MAIQIIKEAIDRKELQEIAEEEFGTIVKAVVDVEQGIMAVGGELHADEEVLLMEQEGSKRQHTWGINLYLDKPEEDFIEFDSMINLKPAFGNRTRGVADSGVRAKIEEIIKKLIAE